MARPVVLLADGSQTRGRVEAELCKRYGTDYRVVTAGSAQEALEALGKLRDGQRQVSLVLAGQRLRDATGTELLARVRQLDPAARRVLLISWGDQASMTAVVQGTVLGGGLWRIRGAVHRGRRAGSHRRPGRYQLADP